MSSRQLEERQEAEHLEYLAGKLDLTLDQIQELDPQIDENVARDGTVTGYNITFPPSDDPATQALIDRLTDGQGWVRTGL